MTSAAEPLMSSSPSRAGRAAMDLSPWVLVVLALVATLVVAARYA